MKFDFDRLFAGRAKEAAPVSSAVSADSIAAAPVVQSLYDNSSGEEYEEFLTLMKAGMRPFRRPGISVRQEYEMWLAARSKQRAAALPNSAQA